MRGIETRAIEMREIDTQPGAHTTNFHILGLKKSIAEKYPVNNQLWTRLERWIDNDTESAQLDTVQASVVLSKYGFAALLCRQRQHRM